MSTVFWLFGFVVSISVAVAVSCSGWTIIEKRGDGWFVAAPLAALVTIVFSLVAMYCGSHAAYEIFGSLN